ncbi:MAG TPA: DNA polymerase III subunit beta [Blastocatellia bacterium]|nr:DNA polymerase III subunit beta [Blastocatellia bacterium]
MMEFTAKRSDLQKELGLVQSVVERKHTIPILANVLIESDDQGVKISGTDLDVSLRTVVPAEVLSGGGVTVEARKLYDIVRTLGEEDVRFRVEDNRLVISCGRSRFRLATLPVENFPQLPQLAVTGGLQLSAKAAVEMVERTVFATTQEESRYALSGVQVEIAPAEGGAGRVRMVATDGHRLALSEMTIAHGTVLPSTTLIPRKTMVELTRLISGVVDETELVLVRDENHVYFKLGSRELISRILTGQFPNYEMVIPKEHERQAVVSGEAFSAALRRVALVADERSRGVRLAFSEGRVELTARRLDEDEEAREDVLCHFTGEPLEIAFNSTYLMDFFQVAGTGDVRIALKDGQSPALLSPEQGEGVYKYVVMPMRLI